MPNCRAPGRRTNNSFKRAWNVCNRSATSVSAAPFAHLEVNVEQLAGTLPRDARLALPGPAQFSLPLLLTFPDRGSILLETKEAGRALAIAALNNLVLRLLSGAPPGRAVFT